MKEKKLVLRTCVESKEVCEKKDLFRVVRTPSGEVIVDTKGKANGRGAYLKKDKDIILKAKKSKSLDKKLVERLLEKYIPEIKDGTIIIKGLARDPGDRSKVAVYSENPDVDAIGACVGEAGNRIKQIVSDLGGEKIDLYKWSDDPVELVSNSLQPASVTKVLEVDKEAKTSKVVVPDDQLSLAIGKSGQNVRLAVQSCGWKIDIMPTSEAYQKGLILK